MSLLPPPHPSAASLRSPSSPPSCTCSYSSSVPSKPSISLRNHRRIPRTVPKVSTFGRDLQPAPRFFSPTFSSPPSDPPSFSSTALSSTVASPRSLQLTQWNLGQKHVFLLNVAACVVAVSASWLFFSAIPTLLAFRRAAESLEKLLDVTAEELPNAMAAVRLSGMEISDLTMELSDLGQEITQGVRSSAKAVRVAEDRLRKLTTIAPRASVQGQTSPREEIEGPAMARTARSIREGIVKGRSVLGVIFTVTHFSKWALNFLSRHKKKRTL